MSSRVEQAGQRSNSRGLSLVPRFISSDLFLTCLLIPEWSGLVSFLDKGGGGSILESVLKHTSVYYN